MLAGSVVMAIVGAPSRNTAGIIGGGALQGAMMLLAGLKPSVGMVAIGAFGVMFAVPISEVSSGTLWQTRVPPDLQGRVTALSAFVSGAALPILYLAAGPLADRVFEPAMANGGRLAPFFGGLIGTGPGRGIALLFMLAGCSILLLSALTWTHPAMRQSRPPIHPSEGV
jgi:hypothetical protein